MRRPLIAIVGIALLGPAEALAEAGWYGSVTGAAAFLSDADLEEAGVAGEATFDTGLGVTGALGQTWPGLLRLGTLRTELEVGYRLNDIDTISAGGVTVSAGDADVSALSGMANVAFDLATGTVRPYALAGVGVAHLSLDSDDLGIDETDTVLAYQAGVGVGFDVAPSVTLFGGYRFFGTADPEFDGVEAEYNSHNVEAGLRLNF